MFLGICVLIRITFTYCFLRFLKSIFKENVSCGVLLTEEHINTTNPIVSLTTISREKNIMKQTIEISGYFFTIKRLRK